MSDLAGNERNKLEKLFHMEDGYVLNFNDRSFRDFFEDYGVDIDGELYKRQGTSKANRLRTFWKVGENRVVGRVIEGLIEYGIDEQLWKSSPPALVESLIKDCKRISQRLLRDQIIAELDELAEVTNERNFELLAEEVRAAIEKRRPEVGLDRLHTYLIKFVRMGCGLYGISFTRNEAIHCIVGKYIKVLRGGGCFESGMAESILSSTISVFDKFNDVRNNRSLAHDNPVLNSEESLLIFNYVTATIRFIWRVDPKIKEATEQRKA